MSVASGATMMGRKQAEALMESTCVIKRAGADTVNATTGAIVPGALTQIYSGKCRLRMSDVRGSDVVAAGQSVAVQNPTLSLPVVGSELVRVDDIVTITSTLDTKVIVARIATVNAQTHATARRLQIEVQS